MAQKKITDLTLRSDFDNTCNIPVDDSTQTYRVTGAQLLTFIKSLTSKSTDITNLTLEASVAASALTIAVKTQAGGNASSTDPISVAMRSSTLTSGLYTNRSITSSLSLVISSGSTLGQVSAQPSRIYVYLIDNAGTLELAASHTYYTEDALVTTVAEGGAGAADSAASIYSTTLRSSVPVRCIGYILNTQATAGTWASTATQIQLLAGSAFTQPTVQTFTSGTGTFVTPAGAKEIVVRMVGGGAGGSGSGTSNSGGNGGAGGNTTFGTTLLVANGGAASASPFNSGTPGTATLGTGPIGTAIQGGYGGAGSGGSGSLANDYKAGGNGGVSPFGGGGYGSQGAAGTAAIANSGSGGGGGGNNGIAGSISGGGGASGGHIIARIGGTSANPLLASYAYAVGSAGAAGSAGTSGLLGGLGSLGYIEVTCLY